MNASEMAAVQDTRTLSFHGYENDRIAAIGQVSVELSCIKGVTTVESVIEEVLIDVTTLDQSSSGNHHSSTHEASHMSVAEEHWYYILIGVVMGVLIMVTVVVIGVLYKQKKACFARNIKLGADNNQVMSISVAGGQKQSASDIEFAGQTMDQKRKSIKQMSKIVEVNESQDIDADDAKKPNMYGKDNFVSNGQLQSIASMQQITDTEDPR